jgi:2-polyprenyl-3-methyl-5-hydroxy-6-metoxy-1,4-benzoquinol methylase
MSQITSGIKSVLSVPIIYNFFQLIMGARKGRAQFVAEYVRPKPGERLIDLGCGTAEILDCLPTVDYTGYDISQAYIHSAQIKFGNRGMFICAEPDEKSVSQFDKFDIAIAIGVLHHLDAASAITMLRTAHAALKVGGRLITIDPCFAADQSIFARFCVGRDRGQNVGTQHSYMALASEVFSNTVATVKHRAWIPYTHCIMESTK